MSSLFYPKQRSYGSVTRVVHTFKYACYDDLGKVIHLGRVRATTREKAEQGVASAARFVNAASWAIL